MYHRYGRHGPGAWLRWYRRHYAHPATPYVPVVQPPTIIVRVYVPSNAERIIFIVATSPSEFNKKDEPEERGVVESDPRDIQYLAQRDTGEIRRIPSPKLGPSLQTRALRRAVDDVYELESLVRSGKYILINRERIRQKGRIHAQNDISSDDLREDFTYVDQLKAYQDAYQSEIDKGISNLGERVTEIIDEKEKNLRETLSHDRAMVQTRSPGDWRARDLVLVRLLQIYYWDCLEKVDINVLLERHTLIDRYEKYLLDFQSRNEVTWPEESF